MTNVQSKSRTRCGLVPQLFCILSSTAHLCCCGSVHISTTPCWLAAFTLPNFLAFHLLACTCGHQFSKDLLLTELVLPLFLSSCPPCPRSHRCSTSTPFPPSRSVPSSSVPCALWSATSWLKFFCSKCFSFLFGFLFPAGLDPHLMAVRLGRRLSQPQLNAKLNVVAETDGLHLSPLGSVDVGRRVAEVV